MVLKMAIYPKYLGWTVRKWKLQLVIPVPTSKGKRWWSSLLTKLFMFSFHYSLSFIYQVTEMFRLTNLATSHLPKANNIFYWQILKNWHFFHITVKERQGTYSSDSSKARLWFTDIQQHELSPFLWAKQCARCWGYESEWSSVLPSKCHFT